MKHKYLTLIIAGALSALSATAHASGYRFGSQSVASQGSADANAAEASDASTVFYNPAGLSRLEGTQFSGGATVVVPHSTYQDAGSTRFTGTPTNGVPTKDYAPNAVVAPALYASHKINEQWSAGVGLFVPYGAKLDYGNDWQGRYALTSIEMKSVALNPSIAFKLDKRHSVGFGITAEHMEAKLDQAVDVPGSIRALNGRPEGAALIRQIMALGGDPRKLASSKDGHGSNDGSDWGFGFNIGYLFQLSEATRFGLAYRSSISHKLKGDTVWDFSKVTDDQVVNKVLAAASHKVNSGALVEVRTPETLSANVFHQIDPKWAAMADVTWTRHSRLENLDIQFPPTTEGVERIRQNWKNSYRVSVGGNYRHSDSLLLRAGLAYDQSPVRSAELTHAALPDSDRLQFSLGANWKLSANSSIDLAYSYLNFKDARINYTNACTPLARDCTGNGETTKGTYQTHMQLLGAAYNYKF